MTRDVLRAVDAKGQRDAAGRRVGRVLRDPRLGPKTYPTGKFDMLGGGVVGGEGGAMLGGTTRAGGRSCELVLVAAAGATQLPPDPQTPPDE